MTPQTPFSGSELAILLAVCLDLFGFGMIVADVQLRAQELTPKGWPTGAVIGFILASTFVMQTILSPWWGRLADRIGRKKVLLGCTALSAAAMAIYSAGFGLAGILLSRVVAGAGGANVAVAQAIATEGQEGQSRTVMLGRISAAVSVGLIGGPVCGGLLVHYRGYRLMAGLAAMLSVVAVCWIAAAVQDSAPKAIATEVSGKPRLGLLSELPCVRPYVVIACVAWLSLATLEGTFARLINYYFHYDQYQFGLVFSYEALLGFVVQSWLLKPILARFPELPVLRVGYMMQGLGLALNPAAVLWASHVVPLGTLMVASTGYAVGGALANPILSGICSRLVPDDRLGELFGLLQSARSIGFVVGPIAGGLLFDLWPPGPYLFAGLVCVGAAFLIPRR